MAERSLRGMSIGAKSLESDDNVDFAARNDVAYVCPKGHRTILPSRRRGGSGGMGVPVRHDPRIVKATRIVRPTRFPSRPVHTGTCYWNAVLKTS